MHLNNWVIRENHGAFHRVLQFPNIPQPFLGGEEVQRFGRDAADFLPHFGAGLDGKAHGEDRNIFRPLAKGRNENRNDAQSVIEIATEGASRRVRCEVAVGSGNYSHVHANRRGATNPLKLLLLEHAQQLGLQVEPHFADFVEQERSAVGALKGPFDPLDRAGKCAPLVPKERAFDEALGEGGAVELNKGAVSAIAAVVNGAGKEFFAGAALAL